MLLVHSAGRFASRSGIADLSSCEWGCVGDVWFNSNCSLDEEIKCLCDDKVARKQASTCISNTCSASDVSQFSLAMESCNNNVPTDPISTHQQSPTPSPTAEPTTTSPTMVITIETSPSAAPSTPSETATTAAPSNASTISSSSPSSTSIGPGVGDGGSLSDSPPTPTGTQGAALSGSANPVIGSSQTPSMVPSIPPSHGTAPIASSSAMPSGLDTLPSSDSTTSGPAIASTAQSGSTPNGISPKVRFGLSAGLGIVFLIIIVATTFLCRRRRQRGQRDTPPVKLSKLEPTESNEDTKPVGSDDHTPYWRKSNYQGVSVDEDLTTLASRPSFSTPPLVPNRLASVQVSGAVAFSDHTARSASMQGEPLSQKISSSTNNSELLNWNGVRDSTCTNTNSGAPTVTTSSASDEHPGRVSQTDSLAMVQAGSLCAPSNWNAGLGCAEKVATAANSQNAEQAAHPQPSPALTALSPPPPPPPPIGTAAAPSRFSSGSVRPRFVTVLMEVREDDTEEQDQPPPYQPRPQGPDVVSPSMIPAYEIH